MRDLVFLLRLHRPAWRRLGLGLALLLVTALSAVGLLGVSGWFIAGSALAGLAALRGFDYLRPSATIRTLALVRTAARYGAQLASHDATFRVLASVRVWFFRAAIPLGFGRLRALRSGDLLNRITADIDTLDHLYLRVVAPVAVAVGIGIVVVLLVAAYAPSLALAVLGLLLVAGAALPWLAERAGRRPGSEVTQLTAQARSDILDGLAGAAELQVFGAADRHRARVATTSESLVARQRRLARMAAWTRAGTLLIANLALVAALWWGLGLVEAGTLAGPVAVMLALGILAAFETVVPLPTAFQHLGRVRAAAARLREIADAPPDVRNPPHPCPLPERWDIDLDRVSFRYPDREAAAVHQVSLTVPEGARIAIVGESGSGKSTLLGLMLRLHDPDAGRVTMGGVDLREVAQADLHRRFAVLTQRADLFQGTLRDNLLLGDPAATDDALWGALERAHLVEFVRGLPDGLDAPVGEGGERLSGGQARRVALARALLRRAPVLLLDEPTEGLDADSHAAVMAGLLDLPWRCSLVVVTHRTVGLSGFDRICRMEDGRLS